MKIYRIAKTQYLEDLSGEGARLYGGRWNKRGYSMLYFSESLSLAVLEILVHMNFEYLNADFKYLEADIPDVLIKQKLKPESMESHWRSNPPSLNTQNLGTNWLHSKKSLAMQVPSAVLPQQYNILVNPRHKNISQLKITKTGVLNVDSRVFEK